MLSNFRELSKAELAIYDMASVAIAGMIRARRELRKKDRGCSTRPLIREMRDLGNYAAGMIGHGCTYDDLYSRARQLVAMEDAQ